MSEDEMYDIIYSYEESERDYHERNIELEEENKELKADLEYKVRLLKRDINDGLRENAAMGAALRESEAENAKLRELLSMYMTFAREMASGYRVQCAYEDGMGRELNETEMRERAMKLGIEWCR